MRVYAVADIHGKHEKLTRIEENIAIRRPDVLVVAGDLTSFKESKNVVSRLNRLPVPALCVRGNTDWPAVDRWLTEFSNTTSLHLCERTVDGIHFAGAGGTVPLPFRSRIHLREKALLKKLAPMVTGDTVLVVHPPPYGTLDSALGKVHVGSGNLRHFLMRTQPRLLICGHVHEHSGIDRVGQTPVVNCAMSAACSGALIEVQEGEIAGIDLIDA